MTSDSTFLKNRMQFLLKQFQKEIDCNDLVAAGEIMERILRINCWETKITVDNFAKKHFKATTEFAENVVAWVVIISKALNELKKGLNNKND